MNPLGRGQRPSANGKIKPTGCLLGACSGRQPMGYRFSLLTLLFSGVITSKNPIPKKSFALAQELLGTFKLLQPRHLLRYRRRTRSHQLSEPGVIAKTCKLRILIHVLNSLVSLLERSSKVLQGPVGVATLGAELGNDVVKACPVLWGR